MKKNRQKLNKKQEKERKKKEKTRKQQYMLVNCPGQIQRYFRTSLDELPDAMPRGRPIVILQCRGIKHEIANIRNILFLLSL